jgi:POT family proton-dependent oligopeptide transporter
MDKDATWEVQLTLPPDVRRLAPVALWPESVAWDDETGTFTVTDVIPERYRQQLLAAGAEPEFREALNSVYRQSSVIKVSIGWLLLFYCLITIGELCLSPVGLSLVTKAAPPKYVGMFMGLWFFTTGAVSNFLAHFVGGMWGTMTPTQYFLIFGVVAAAATVIMLLLLRVLKPMLHGVH